MNKNRTFREYMTGEMSDNGKAAVYLSVALEEYIKDGDIAAFLVALRTVVDANGGIARLAQTSGLNRQHLHRMLTGNGNPTLETLKSILSPLGLTIAIHPK
jgi:probable addiction module antidote protein